MADLLLRRANVSRSSASWQHEDFDVFDGDRNVDRIYRLNAATERWFWGVSFLFTGLESCGMADSRDGSKAALKVEYDKWRTAMTPRKGLTERERQLVEDVMRQHPALTMQEGRAWLGRAAGRLELHDHR